MSAPESSRIKAAAALTIVAGAIAVGTLMPQVSADKLRSEVDWDNGTPPSQVECLACYGLARGPALQLLGLDDTKGPQYGWLRQCYDPTADAGQQSAPDGFDSLGDTCKVVPFVSGMKRTTGIIGAGQPEYEHACSTGANCERRVHRSDGSYQWVAEPRTGNTLSPGDWRGTGCLTKVAMEWAGNSSMPAECLPESPAP